jgi:hypothetical protein
MTARTKIATFLYGLSVAAQIGVGLLVLILNWEFLQDGRYSALTPFAYYLWSIPAALTLIVTSIVAPRPGWPLAYVASVAPVVLCFLLFRADAGGLL